MKGIKMKALKMLMVALTSISLFAATATFPLGTTAPGMAVSLVETNSGAITSITFVNPSAGAITLGFFDTPNTNLLYAIGAYTNNVVTSGTTIVTNVNILGTTVLQTNSTITTTLTPVATNTGNYPKLLTYTVPATTTTVIPWSPAIYFGRGLAITNSATNVAVTVQYQSAR